VYGVRCGGGEDCDGPSFSACDASLDELFVSASGTDGRLVASLIVYSPEIMWVKLG
jgi:hypothetical protein